MNAAAVNDMTAEPMAVISNGMTPLTILATPWAVDANGQQRLPTEFVYDDGVLTRVVDTTDAAFPVVSDPLPLVGIALVPRLEPSRRTIRVPAPPSHPSWRELHHSGGY